MLNQIKVGDTISAYCWTSGETFDAKIQSIDTVPSSNSNYNGSGNPNVSYYEFEAYAKDASKIQGGEYLELTFNSVGDTTSSIWLSKAYVKQEGNKYYVLKDVHGKLKKQYVTVGKIVWGDTMEIKDGLSDTDYIAFAYSKNAKEGVKTQKIFGGYIMIENIRLSFRGIFTHKMRSFLTMLGIIIGIASIIAIVSTIKGTNDQIEKNLIGSGNNTVKLALYQEDWEYSFDSGIPNGVPTVSKDTLKSLKNIDHVEGVSLYRSRQSYQAIFRNNTSLDGGYIMGVQQDYFSISGLTIKKGRGITDKDNKKFRQVAVLDETSARLLFGEDDPIGKTIEISSTPFTIVGVCANKENFEPSMDSIDEYYTYNQSTGSKVYVPIESWPLFYQFDEPQSALLKVDATSNMTSVGKEATDVLNTYVSSSNVQYKAQDLLKQAKDIQNLSKSTNAMLIWIAGISLLVGGIGVMNIMLVTVTERTKEIGLKKAIGAKKKAILFQFLTEAIVLTSIGGIAGVITGIGLAKLISILNGTPVSISIPAMILSVLFSMAIGIIFGLLPSYKATNLDPIEALRHE